MTRFMLALAGAAVIGGSAISAATGMPAADLAGLGQLDVQNVRVICDEFDRCYRTHPRRFVQRRIYVDPGFYGPAYTYDPYPYWYAGPSFGVGIGLGHFGGFGHGGFGHGGGHHF